MQKFKIKYAFNGCTKLNKNAGFITIDIELFE